MVNRATFYRHYEDKYDLLKSYMKELSEFIDSQEEETLLSKPPPSFPDTPPPGLARLLRHMQANSDFYRVMLGKQGDPAFCGQAFRDYIEEGYRQILSQQASQPNPDRPPI
jgi:AcrR family transcriptional regulator